MQGYQGQQSSTSSSKTNGGAPPTGSSSAASGSTASRPYIDAGNLDLEAVTAEAWKALLGANRLPFLFSYGTRPVRVELDDDGTPILRAVTPDRLRHILARVATWIKIGEETINSALPPTHVVRDMMATPNLPLPVLTRVVGVPVFAPDGTLHSTPGYYSGSRCYYQPAPGFSVPPIPDRPAAAEVAKARALILHDLLADFPFVGEPEAAHVVALLLLTFARDLIEGPTPLHLIEKPSPGTGATLLADVVTRPALGKPVSAMTEAADEAEWQRKITAKLRSGPPIIQIDNLRRPLESAALSSAITAIAWEDRVVRTSETVRLPVRCVWVATGNNPQLSREMARRTIRIRLDAKKEKPWLRAKFQHPDLRCWVVEHRAELVWAALTMIRAWLAAGRPPGGKTLGMFERWAAVMGGILEVAGIPGFLGNLADFYDNTDEETAQLEEFIRAWWTRHQGTKVRAADLFTFAATRLALGGGSQQVQLIRLGLRLRSLRDRQIAGYRVLWAGNYQGSGRWKLVKVP